MALTALTEPRTLWRRITRYPSPRRRVALHSISTMYVGHWSERMWSVNLDASISGVSDPRSAFLPAFRVTGSADDKPGSSWERRRHVWEHLESQSCIQFVFSSMYVCIYIATHLHTLYLDWLPSAEYILPVTLSTSVTPLSPYTRPCSLTMHLEAVIEWVVRCTWRLWSSEFGDALWGRDRASLEMQLEAVIVRTWRP